MNSLRTKLGLGAASLAIGVSLVLGTAGATFAGTSGTYTCTGGSIPGGTYGSIRVEGFCTVDAGNVTANGHVVVAKGAGLLAAFGGSSLHVKHWVRVNRQGILVLGCEASAFPCLNDNQHHPTMNSSDFVGGDLQAHWALAAIIHLSRFNANVILTSGGGGLNCNNQAALQNQPAYADMEDNAVGGSVWITGLRTCWAGFIRNKVTGSVTYSDNDTADPDGNEFVTNAIAGDLVCFQSAPAPQVGDSAGSLNTVSGRAYGQCRDLVN